MSQAAVLSASITQWTRLEPTPYQATMEQTLQARIADPMWTLCRQFQLGEFTGEDTGSPVQATLSVESRDLTSYAPADAALAPIDQALPIETHVEREEVVLSLRAAMQWGLKFERMARAAGTPHADIAQYRQAFPIPAASPADLPDPRSSAFRTAITGRVTNGVALYTALVAGEAMPVTGTDFTAILHDFRTYRESLYTEPAADPAWVDRDLRYEFSVASTASDQIVLRAPRFDGDRIDWYSFDPAPAALDGQAASVSSQTFSFLPQHVTFHGMPAPGWWELEDAQTDFGKVDAAHVDLAKMLVMEFGLIFGCDWFEIPIPVDIGSLTRVDSLVVSDTFGQRTLIRSAAEVDQSAGQGPWSMFAIADIDQRLPWMLMPPSLGVVMDADALEEVMFLRDDLAALAWGVEHRLAGPMDRSLDGYEAWRQRLRQQPEISPQPGNGAPDIYYLLQTTVPDNWIPLVPVLAPSAAPFLRRGVIERPGLAGPVPVTAHGVILHPQAPFFVRGEAVPAAGVAVQRRFRRCRWLDGQTYLWSSRLVQPGRGPGWSGLAYDLVLPTGQVLPEMEPRL
jgi:hypothetical protein